MYGGKHMTSTTSKMQVACAISNEQFVCPSKHARTDCTVPGHMCTQSLIESIDQALTLTLPSLPCLQNAVK